MSNIEAPAGEAEEISPEEGVAEPEAEQVQADQEPVEPQYEYLEVDDSIRSKHVPVKVDGEETSVPFDELVNSYSRESVSTKRFQEAAAAKQEAEQALRLQQALQLNPGLTVQYLAQQAGTSVEDYLGMSPQQRQNATDTQQATEAPKFEDPLEQKFYEQEQQLQAIQEQMAQRAADEQLRAAVGNLKATYQIDDSRAREVVATAAQMGVGIEGLPMVYESLAFRAAQQAVEQHTSTQEAEKIQRQQAAANAAAIVGSGTPSAAGTTSEVAPTFTSSREAIAAALDGLGIA